MMLYTIGHSTRTLEAFLALLDREGVRHVADVRRFPASRRYPHFDGRALADALAANGIDYSHHPELGGRRTPAHGSVNAGWRNAGFRGYADYMQTAAFTEALERLERVAATTTTAIMCAESVPWRCHRSLLADALVARGGDVRHILDAKTTVHTITPFAVVREARVSYPVADAASQESLFPG